MEGEEEETEMEEEKEELGGPATDVLCWSGQTYSLQSVMGHQGLSLHKKRKKETEYNNNQLKFN